MNENHYVQASRQSLDAVDLDVNDYTEQLTTHLEETLIYSSLLLKNLSNSCLNYSI